VFSSYLFILSFHLIFSIPKNQTKSRANCAAFNSADTKLK